MGFSTVKATAHDFCIKALLEKSTDTTTASVQNTTRYTRHEKAMATMQGTSPLTAHFTTSDTAHDTCALTGLHT